MSLSEIVAWASSPLVAGMLFILVPVMLIALVALIRAGSRGARQSRRAPPRHHPEPAASTAAYVHVHAEEAHHVEDSKPRMWRRAFSVFSYIPFMGWALGVVVLVSLLLVATGNHPTYSGPGERGTYQVAPRTPSSTPTWPAPSPKASTQTKEETSWLEAAIERFTFGRCDGKYIRKVYTKKTVVNPENCLIRWQVDQGCIFWLDAAGRKLNQGRPVCEGDVVPGIPGIHSLDPLVPPATVVVVLCLNDRRITKAVGC